MDTTQKIKTRYFIIAVALILASAAIFFVFFEQSTKGQYTELTLYYYDTSAGEWNEERQGIRLTEQTTFDTTLFALEYLQKISEQSPSRKTVPKGLIQETSIDKKTLIVRFSDVYNTLSLLERNVAVASVVYTLTDIDDIDNVLLYVGDNEITVGGRLAGLLNRKRVILNSELLPDNVGTRTVCLYFANTSLEGLVAVWREIELQPNKPLENHLIEELIAGSDAKDCVRLIPSDVRLRDNARVDGGVCYVDFSYDFLSRYDNEETLELLIYSIVNTIIDNTDVIQVQLLFGGDKTSVQLTAFDLGKPLTRFESGL